MMQIDQSSDLSNPTDCYHGLNVMTFTRISYHRLLLTNSTQVVSYPRMPDSVGISIALACEFLASTSSTGWSEYCYSKTLLYQKTRWNFCPWRCLTNYLWSPTGLSEWVLTSLSWLSIFYQHHFAQLPNPVCNWCRQRYQQSWSDCFWLNLFLETLLCLWFHLDFWHEKLSCSLIFCFSIEVY